MIPTLEHYQDNAPFDMPLELQKNQSRIHVHYFIWSAKAVRYYNVAFIGTMLEWGAMTEEIVLGHVEIEKSSGRIDPGNIRYLRMGKNEKRKLARFINMLVDFMQEINKIA